MMIKLIILIFQTKICPGTQIMNSPDKKIKRQNEKFNWTYSCVQNNSSAAKTSENIGLLIVASMFKHTNTFE